jgi:hypothetical protein
MWPTARRLFFNRDVAIKTTPEMGEKSGREHDRFYGKTVTLAD